MSAESKFPEEFTFTWRIENYSFIYHEREECIRSRLFSAENLGGSKWFLYFYPRGTLRAYNTFQCYLHKVANNDEEEQIILNEKIDIISANGTILKSKKREKVVYNENPPLSVEMNNDDLAKKMERCEEDTLIIRCCITGNEKRKRKPIRYEFKSRINIDRCAFKWNVGNFNSEAWSESKIFHFLRTSHTEITLTAPEDALLINIRKPEDNATPSRFATCKVSLLDAEGLERQSKKYTHFFDIEDNISTWEFPSFITKTQLNAEGRTFLKNGTFTFMCELSVSSGFCSEMCYESDISLPVHVYSPNDNLSALKEDLRSMFSNKKHSDVKLRVGFNIFPAHKSFLAARSPVFSAMFDQDMLESQTGIVDIPDMDAETLNSFLSFIYTGTIDNMDFEVTLKLLVAADKYQVESLKEKCASFLTSDLSDENACDVFVAADMVRHKLLKEDVQDYIKARAGKILLTRKWSQWIENNIKLASEILSDLSVEFGTSADEVSVHHNNDVSSPENVVPPMDETFLSLKGDLRSLLSSKKYSDVKLQVGGEIFPAHKNLLAARSPVFSAMFDQDMLESQTGIVDILDMDAETLNSFLSFVYTGTVEKMDFEVTLKLLLAADKYQVESLKEKCASFLKSDLSDENACEVLVIADMVEYKLLKEFVQDYIKTRAGKILSTQEWSQWIEKNSRLAIEILSKMSAEFGALAENAPVTEE